MLMGTTGKLSRWSVNFLVYGWNTMLRVAVGARKTGIYGHARYFRIFF